MAIAERSVLKAEIDDHKHKIAELEESEQELNTKNDVVSSSGVGISILRYFFMPIRAHQPLLQMAVQMKALNRTNEELLSYKQESERLARELENQKQTNQQLRTEIERLESSLQQVRRHGRDSTSASGVLGTDSESGTLSRNLGTEMFRSMFEPEGSDVGSSSRLASPVESVAGRVRDRTIIRTIYRSTPSLPNSPREDDGVSNTDQYLSPTEVSTEEDILEVSYEDAGTATDPILEPLDASAQTDESMLGSLPPYSKHQSAGEVIEALSAAHPHLFGTLELEDMTTEKNEMLQQAYKDISGGIGVRCEVLEKKLREIQKKCLEGQVQGVRRQRSGSSSSSSKNIGRGRKMIDATAWVTENKVSSLCVIIPSCIVLGWAIGYISKCKTDWKETIFVHWS